MRGERLSFRGFFALPFPSAEAGSDRGNPAGISPPCCSWSRPGMGTHRTRAVSAVPTCHKAGAASGCSSYSANHQEFVYRVLYKVELQNALEEGAHKKPGRVQYVAAPGTFLTTLGRAFPPLGLGHRFSGLGLSCLFSWKWCSQKPKHIREDSDFECSWEMEGVLAGKLQSDEKCFGT